MMSYLKRTSNLWRIETRLSVSVGWGVLWGPTTGFWLLAPHFLHSHQMHPGTFSQWLVIEFALCITFVTIGTVCVPFAAFPLVVWKAVSSRDFQESSWAYGVAIGTLLFATYLGLAELIVWSVSGTLVGIASYQAVLGGAVVLYAAISVASFLVYRWLVAVRRVPSPALLVLILVATAFIGAAAVPFRIAAPPRPEVVGPQSLTRLAGEPSAAVPLLFVGIDSGDWRPLRPLLDQGRLPTLAHLSSEGIRGTVSALWPPFWSAPAWAAIVTGYAREETGIYEDLAIKAPGLPAYQVPLAVEPSLVPILALQSGLVRMGVLHLSPIPRSMLHRPPFWELVARAGVETAVVRLPFTFPANGQAHIVISDWVGRDSWKLAGVHTDTAPDRVSPVSRAAEFLSVFARDVSPPASDLATFLSNPAYPRPADAVFDPVEMLRLALDIDRRTLEVSERLLKSQPDLRVLAVYLGGLDTICHAFWSYRFPEDFPDKPPARADVEELGPIIDRYLEFLDQGLGRLIAGFSTRPNVLVVSDHGHQAINRHPLWRGWHSPQGIFIAAGPGVPRRLKELDVSYYDVVPTMMALLGFAKPEGILGSALLNR